MKTTTATTLNMILFTKESDHTINKNNSDKKCNNDSDGNGKGDDRTNNNDGNGSDGDTHRKQNLK